MIYEMISYNLIYPKTGTGLKYQNVVLCLQEKGASGLPRVRFLQKHPP